MVREECRCVAMLCDNKGGRYARLPEMVVIAPPSSSSDVS